MDDGWKAENMESAAVGPQARITEIKELRSRYEQVLAAHDELDARMRNGKDTPESRSLLRERDAEMHRLRDRLILLCNGHTIEVRTAAAHPDRWKWALAAVLAIGFTAAVASCIRRLYFYVPSQAGRLTAGAVFFSAAVALAVIGFQELAKRKDKLVTANFVGCYTLLVVGLAVAAFAIMLLSVLLMYRGVYTLL
jgi:hypothetical protein